MACVECEQSKQSSAPSEQCKEKAKNSSGREKKKDKMCDSGNKHGSKRPQNTEHKITSIFLNHVDITSDFLKGARV